MRVEHLYRYPVKGLTAEALEDVTLSPGQCLPHDRRFALAQGDAPLDPAAPAWLPKFHRGTGPLFAAIKVTTNPVPMILPLRDGTAIKHRFREALLGARAFE